MSRTTLFQGLLMYRYEEAHEGRRARRLTQENAARLPRVSERTFLRYLFGYKPEGMDGLVDAPLGQISNCCAPVDEGTRLAELYRGRYSGWNVRHFYSFYCREHGGTRCYTWVKNTLHREGRVLHGKNKDSHRKKQDGLYARILFLCLQILLHVNAGFYTNMLIVIF